MIGFPDYIKDPQKLKEKYDGVSLQRKQGSQNYEMLFIKELRLSLNTQDDSISAKLFV